MNRRCELCGDDRDTKTALAWYREGGVRAIDRCRDIEACRERVTDRDEEWPLISPAEARART